MPQSSSHDASIPTPHSGARVERAVGELRVWLTAGGLAVGLMMITGLLALISWKGVSVFWPAEVRLVRLAAGVNGAGEESFAGVWVKEQMRRGLEGEPVLERQYFTGNKQAGRLAFRHVDVKRILEETLPRDILLAERLQGGDAIFFPTALVLEDGTRVEAGAVDFDKHLMTQMAEARLRRERLRHLERQVLPKLSARMLALEGRGEAASAELAEARFMYEKQVAEVRALRERAAEAVLECRLGSGEESRLMVAEILSIYAPNGLSWAEKVGIFTRAVWAFLSEEPREANTEGGIFPAVFGTFVMTLLMALLVTPLGIIAAVYLREYARQGGVVRVVRICVNNLAGVPSIVFGVFGLGFFVYGAGGFLDGGPEHPLPPVWWSVAVLGGLGAVVGAAWLGAHHRTLVPGRAVYDRAWRRLEGGLWVAGVLLLVVALARCPYFEGFFAEKLPAPTFGTGGILWASLTLALMTLPVVIVATEEALAAVPRGVREAALACGASRWQMIQRVALPGALPGVMTGVILAMARGAGEVAPLMITGVVKLAPTLPVDLEWPFLHAERKFMHLGFHIYDLGFQSPDSEAAIPMVFATTLLLILLVVVLNLAAIHIRSRLRARFQVAAF